MKYIDISDAIESAPIGSEAFDAAMVAILEMAESDKLDARRRRRLDEYREALCERFEDRDDFDRLIASYGCDTIKLLLAGIQIDREHVMNGPYSKLNKFYIRHMNVCQRCNRIYGRELKRRRRSESIAIDLGPSN
jgi:hypothetical protein